MNDLIPRYGLKNFNAVNKKTIKKLLELEQGRFPTERINNMNDIMLFEKMHSMSSEAHFNCDTCG